MNPTNPKPRPVPPCPVPDCPHWVTSEVTTCNVIPKQIWNNTAAGGKEWILKKLMEIKDTPFHSCNQMNPTNPKLRPVPPRPVPFMIPSSPPLIFVNHIDNSLY